MLLLGDAGYRLTSWLLVPFDTNKELSEAEHLYNYQHSRSRMAVETAFGWLKMRWSCLRNSLDRSHAANVRMIISCIVLHNIMIECNDNAFDEDLVVQEDLFDQSHDNVAELGDTRDIDRAIGRARRAQIAEFYFQDNKM